MEQGKAAMPEDKAQPMLLDGNGCVGERADSIEGGGRVVGALADCRTVAEARVMPEEAGGGVL
jgi:hypothetical protein